MKILNIIDNRGYTPNQNKTLNIEPTKITANKFKSFDQLVQNAHGDVVDSRAFWVQKCILSLPTSKQPENWSKNQKKNTPFR